MGITSEQRPLQADRVLAEAAAIAAEAAAAEATAAAADFATATGPGGYLSQAELDAEYVANGELTVNAARNGLDPGNTAADNTTALTAILTAADALGATVFVPAGDYEIESVQVPVPAQLNGLIIRGAGIGRTRFVGTIAGAMFTVGDGGLLDAQHVAFYDLTVDGNNVAAEGFRLNGTRFFTLHRAIVRNFTDYCLNFLGGAGIPNYFADVQDSRISAAPIPVMLNGDAGEGANSNYFTRCHFGSPSNINYNGAGVAISVVIDGGDANVFRDCEFISSPTTGAYLHNSAVGNKFFGNQFDGPSVAVHVASAGVQSTVIIGNSGTVNITDSGTNTLFFGNNSNGSIGPNLFASGGFIIGGPNAKTNVVPLRVRLPAAHATDGFRVDDSTGTRLFKVDQVGNVEVGAGGAVTAHAHSTFDNAVGNSVSMTVDTGTAGMVSNIGLRVRKRNAAQTANLVAYIDAANAVIGGIGPKAEVLLAVITTAARPAAATAGKGAVIYDDTLGLPIFSDGASWKKFDGSAA